MCKESPYPGENEHQRSTGETLWVGNHGGSREWLLRAVNPVQLEVALHWVREGVSGKGPFQAGGSPVPWANSGRSKTKVDNRRRALSETVVGLMSPPARPLDPGRVAKTSLSCYTWVMGHAYRAQYLVSLSIGMKANRSLSSPPAGLQRPLVFNIAFIPLSCSPFI